MTPKSKRTGLVAVLAVALIVIASLGVVVAGCGSSELPSAGGSATTAAGTATTAAGTATSAGQTAASLNGAGATFPKPLYVEWIGEFQAANPGIKINYQGIGSGGGIEQFTKMTVDFGASDAPMKDEEITAAETASGAQVLHIPTVFGSVVLAYNVPDAKELKLDSDTLGIQADAQFLAHVIGWEAKHFPGSDVWVTQKHFIKNIFVFRIEIWHSLLLLYNNAPFSFAEGYS